MFKIKNIKKSKIAAMATGAAVKIIIAVVCGALLLTGTYGVIKFTVLPNTKARTKAIADYDGTGGAGGGDFADYVKYTDDFEDGPVQSYFYSSLENAIADANNNTTANALSDVSGAKAKIEVKEKDGGYIVKPMADCNIAATQTLSGNYIFDANGKTISLASGACLSLSGADITFRDSENGKIIKDVNSEINEKMIVISSASTAPSNITFINGNYILKNNNIKGGGSLLVIPSNYTMDSNLNIAGGNFDVSLNSSVSGSRIAQIKNHYKIAGGNFNFKNINTANTGWSYGLYITTNSIGEISGGKVMIEGESEKIAAIYLASNSIDTKINGGTFIAKCINANSENLVSGIRLASNGTVEINNCTTVGISMKNLGFGLLIANGNPVINGGNFYGEAGGAYLCSGTINGGYYSGIVAGVNIFKNQVDINGGTFESCDNGGAFIGGPKTIIKNATFKCVPYKKLRGYEPYFKDNIGKSVTASVEEMRAQIYLCGNSGKEVKVFVDNCKFENDKDIVMASNGTSKLNAHLYISNCETKGNFRVDGVGTNGNQGHLYVGKNVKYKGITGSGPVDKETYKNVSFTPEYVAENFN